MNERSFIPIPRRCGAFNRLFPIEGFLFGSFFLLSSVLPKKAKHSETDRPEGIGKKVTRFALPTQNETLVKFIRRAVKHCQHCCYRKCPDGRSTLESIGQRSNSKERQNPENEEMGNLVSQEKSKRRILIGLRGQEKNQNSQGNWGKNQ